MLPIYYVIEEEYRVPSFIQFRILNVIAVFECDITDIDEIHNKHVAPLRYMGRNIYTEMFLRSPGGSFLAVPKSGIREADRIPEPEIEVEPSYPKEVWEI
jgi:hypothetical protein